MLEDLTSRIALVASIVVHAALVAPVWSDLVAPAAERAAPAAEREPLAFRFVDPQPVPAEEPEAPSDLVSTTDSRAAQPEAPPDLRRGAAYQAGRTAVPVTPRSAGAPDAGSPAPPQPPAEAAAPAEADARPADEARAQARVALPDPRLALPREPIAGGRASPAPPGAERLPVPEVDQRLTRATAGSAFSLNTTAWEYGPYMARLKRAIEEHVSPPAAFYYGTAAWITRVRFRIGPDGRLERLELLDHRGVENLQYVSVDAIRGAADFEPLPPGFPEPYLEVTGHFYFNVLPR